MKHLFFNYTFVGLKGVSVLHYTPLVKVYLSITNQNVFCCSQELAGKMVDVP